MKRLETFSVLTRACRPCDERINGETLLSLSLTRRNWRPILKGRFSRFPGKRDRQQAGRTYCRLSEAADRADYGGASGSRSDHRGDLPAGSRLGVAGLDPREQRDRNLINRELSDLAGCTTQGHSRPSPQVLTRVGRGRYQYREPDRPMDVELLREYLESAEVYEKRPARRRRGGSDRREVPGVGGGV